MRLQRLLLSVLLAFGLSESAIAQQAVARTGQCGDLTNNLYRFCYNGATWLVDEPLNVRFTNRDRVEVEVQLERLVQRFAGLQVVDDLLAHRVTPLR